DGRPQPFTLYVPATDPAKKVPLYVGLHGMNGGPMSMLRIFFGGDDEGKTMSEMERAFEGVQTTKLQGFVLAPHAHGNAMYRQLGETEVMELVAWAIARYPNIDPDRVYITGFSMGGIGAASIPLHHPDVFAAAQPLCGYHSYAIRRDIHGRPLRAWESFLIEDRSNTEWAFNGLRLPMYVVHGTKDLPEENSGVLIDAYERLGFSMKHEHPDKGHDVWGWAYDHLDQVKYFAGRRRDPHPKRVRFRTTRPRYGDDAWVHVDRLVSSTEWGVVDATVENKHAVRLKTKGITALHLDRDPVLLDPGAVTLTLDAQKLVFAEGEALVAHQEGAGWVAGAPKDDGLHKEGRIAGPIRDAWNEPLTLIYGASDPLQITANREVAQQLARVRWGVDVQYPIVADTEVDPLAPPKTSIVLVGNAASNRITRALEAAAELPIVIDGATLRFAGKSFTGSELGAAFVVPHPKATQHYLLVIEGVDALGTFRALSLPELLPDFVIWDSRLAAARGQQVLSFGAARAAGFFDQSWKPPATFDDPLLDKVAGPKSEKDSTSYLP
ncbi:MAG: PHB depolymerase family esterase, partial [Polyangiales bacterium]